jgi:serine/threonine protein kinase
MPYFSKGDIIKIGNEKFVIDYFIESASQGSVYAGHNYNTYLPCAIKHLYGHYSTDNKKFYEKLLFLTKIKLPVSFVWPTYISSFNKENQSFLYTMPLLTDEWNPIEIAIKNPELLLFKEKLMIAIEYCKAFSSLHEKGLAYTDISENNLFFKKNENNSISVAIIDNENCITNGYSLGMVGSGLFVAPEIFKGEIATIDSDIHSLNVLIFSLLVGCHPLDGRRTQSEKNMNELSIIKNYGIDPIFIFDYSHRNGLDYSENKEIFRKWENLSTSLRTHFQYVFSTACLQKKNMRPPLSQLQKLLEELLLEELSKDEQKQKTKDEHLKEQEKNANRNNSSIKQFKDKVIKNFKKPFVPPDIDNLSDEELRIQIENLLKEI